MGEQKRTPTPSESIPDDNDFEEVNEEDLLEVIYLDEEEEGDLEDDEEMEEYIEEKRHFDVESDDSICTFGGHEGSVFCCDLNPADPNIAVTGGEDDLAYVWKIEEQTVQFELGGFKDSVNSVKFSHDGIYVAGADLSGKVQVFKVADGSNVWEFDTADVNWLAWHPSAHVLFAGDIAGAMWMWQIPSGNCKTFQGPEGNDCGKLLHDGKRFVCGYADGTLRIFDLKLGKTVHSWTGDQGHLSAVTSLDVKSDDSLLITGSTDGTAKLYNIVTGKLLSTFVCSTEGQDAQSTQAVETVAFAPASLGLTLAATGTLKGIVSLWDLPTHVERSRITHTDGIVRLAWAPDQPLLITGSLDGVVSTIDARSGTVIKKQTGHTSNILDMCLSKNASFVLTSSDDSTAKIFKLSD